MQQASGVVLLCDGRGVLKQVLHDDLGACEHLEPGMPLMRWVERGSQGKVLRLLTDLRRNGVVYDWEITVPIAEAYRLLYVAGISVADSVLIGATCSPSPVTDFYAKLTETNNDLVNQLRVVLKQKHQNTARSNESFEGLTELNNELANAQRELAKKNASLQRLNEEKNHFIGMAAHDLRNPLGVVVMFTELLTEQMEEVLTQDQREFLNIIKGSGEFMLGLVNDLLDKASIEAGKLHLRRETVDLEALIARNVAVNGALTRKKKDITATWTCLEALPMMNVDPAKIEQVLNNLISNALKYSYPGTQVEVRARRIEGFVEVAVADQGQGIPQEEQRTLFQAFQTTSVQSTAGEKSTGLGLSIVSKIVQGHGGRIWVESTVGVGSTFYFTLPLSE